MNSVNIVGNLTRDPETRTTANGISHCSFTVAVNRRVKNADGTRSADYINVSCWRQLADLCAQYLAKGRKVAVTGSLQTRDYTAQDGSKRYVTEVLADSVDFLSSASASDSARSAAASAPAAPQEMAPVDDEDLPFGGGVIYAARYD